MEQNKENGAVPDLELTEETAAEAKGQRKRTIRRIVGILFQMTVWIGVLHTAYSCISTGMDPYTSFPWYSGLVLVGVPYLVAAVILGLVWLTLKQKQQ